MWPLFQYLGLEATMRRPHASPRLSLRLQCLGLASVSWVSASISFSVSGLNAYAHPYLLAAAVSCRGMTVTMANMRITFAIGVITLLTFSTPNERIVTISITPQNTRHVVSRPSLEACYKSSISVIVLLPTTGEHWNALVVYCFVRVIIKQEKTKRVTLRVNSPNRLQFNHDAVMTS